MKRPLSVLVGLLLAISSTYAWDYEGHRWVNQLALASLPTNFPAFVQTPEARERIAFLSGEPDRWRNTSDLCLKHFNSPDHYLDIDDLHDYGLKPEALSEFRYEFDGQLASARALHPTNFPAVDAAQNADKTKELVGFLPWTIAEYYGKLKSGFSYLKAFEEGGSQEEIANAQQNIIYIMGVMGHFIGDSVQPLHTTKHFNGWVGDNPTDYSTRKSFHSWIDGGFVKKSGIRYTDMVPQVQPAKMLWEGDPKAKHETVFPEIMTFILDQHKLVEPLYQLEKDHKLSGDAPSAEGKKFITDQMLKGGTMLGSLWYSAWQQAAPDTYLRGRLLDRKANKKAD
jgi:hypothetical protein